MSEWNHPICDPCWIAREQTRVPVRIVDRQAERCCVCGAETRSGIYQRADPTSTSMPSHVDGRHDD